MAAAILIDATLVRGVLLPAGLALLGDRAWWPGERAKWPQHPAVPPAVPLARAGRDPRY